MYPKKDSFSIVILGSWNPSIFSQEWILKHLCQPGTTNFTISFPLDDPTAPRKIDFDDISIFPGRKQLLLQPQTTNIDGMKKCSIVATKILQLLMHTPVTHCGINFSFEEKNQLEKIFGVLGFVDRTAIDAQKYKLEGSSASRKFRLTDGNVLNLMLSDNEGVGQIGFNFHYELFDIEKYRVMFEGGQHVEGRFSEAVAFCQSTYGLKLDDEE